MPVLAEPAAEGACRGSKLRPRGHLCSTSSKPPQTSSDNTHTRHHTPEQTPPTTQKHTRPNGTTGTTGSTSTTQRHHQHHQHHRHHTPDVGAPRVSANRSRARPCKGRACAEPSAARARQQLRGSAATAVPGRRREQRRRSDQRRDVFARGGDSRRSAAVACKCQSIRGLLARARRKNVRFTTVKRATGSSWGAVFSGNCRAPQAEWTAPRGGSLDLFNIKPNGTHLGEQFLPHNIWSTLRATSYTWSLPTPIYGAPVPRTPLGA